MMEVHTLGKLIYNEWIKYFNRLGTWIMLALIIVFMLLPVVLTMQFGSTKYDSKTYGDNWKTEVKQDIKEMQQELVKINKKKEKDRSIDDYNKLSSYDERISELSFYLKKDVQPPAKNDVYGEMLGVNNFVPFIAIMIIVMCSSLMSREHQQGTIKLLLIRPASRIKIFTSKLIFTFIASFIFLLFGYLVKFIISMFTSEMNPTSKIAVKSGEEMKYKMVEFMPLLMKHFFNEYIYIVIFAVIAYALSVLFRNTSLSMGVTFTLLFFADIIVMFLQSKTDLVKYLWPANWWLNQYNTDHIMPLPVDDMTYTFSFIYNIIALLIVIIVTAFIFKKRDVAN